MSILLGNQVTAGLSVAPLGLSFRLIPSGSYLIGAPDDDEVINNNPVRNVTLDSSFEMAATPTTNHSYQNGLEQLGAQNTLLMVEAPESGAFVIVARGTRKEVVKLEKRRLAQTTKEMGLPKIRFKDGQPCSPFVGPLTLEPHSLPSMNGPDQPAIASFFEASAFAALFGLRLPTGEEWEVATGELRDIHYKDEERLRRVAHFYRDWMKQVSPSVGSLEPNKFGLYDMLGCIWEWMANRFSKHSEDREIRGGSWASSAIWTQSAYRADGYRNDWNWTTGFRLVRSQG